MRFGPLVLFPYGFVLFILSFAFEINGSYKETSLLLRPKVEVGFKAS
jgi:hypothetical protein